MSQQTQLSLLTVAIGTDIKSLYGKAGNLSLLTTAEKNSLVGAINELLTTIQTSCNNAAGDFATAINNLRSEILGGASSAMDTLKEIEDYLNLHPDQSAAILTALGNRVRYDAVQNLNTAQMTQACNNIGIGDPTYDYVADYVAAKA